MANDIGWGKAFDPESGWGMAAVTGAEIGYGTIVINSHSGETNISSQDRDNEPADAGDSMLAELPLIYADGGVLYLYFLLQSDFTPFMMSYTLFRDGDPYLGDNLSADGISMLTEIDYTSEWSLMLSIYPDDINVVEYSTNVVTA